MDKIGGAIISVNTSLQNIPGGVIHHINRYFTIGMFSILNNKVSICWLLVRFHTLKIECYAKRSC